MEKLICMLLGHNQIYHMVIPVYIHDFTSISISLLLQLLFLTQSIHSHVIFGINLQSGLLLQFLSVCLPALIFQVLEIKSGNLFTLPSLGPTKTFELSVTTKILFFSKISQYFATQNCWLWLINMFVWMQKLYTVGSISFEFKSHAVKLYKFKHFSRLYLYRKSKPTSIWLWNYLRWSFPSF